MYLSWFECRSSPPQVHVFEPLGWSSQLEKVGPWSWLWWVAEFPGFQPKFSASWFRVYTPATAKSRVALPSSSRWAANHEPKSSTFKLLLGVSSCQLEKIMNPMFYIVFHILSVLCPCIYLTTVACQYKVTYPRFVLELGKHWTESHPARVSRGNISFPVQEMPALHSLASSYIPKNDKQDSASW